MGYWPLEDCQPPFRAPAMAATPQTRLVLLLFYILCLHAIAIFFFTRGFLLTRNELPLYSTCDDAASFTCPPFPRGATIEESGPAADHVPSPKNGLHRNVSYDDQRDKSRGASPAAAPSDAIDEGRLKAPEAAPDGTCSCSTSTSDYAIHDGRLSSFVSNCWTPPAVRRVVILILDALRFDFVAPSNAFRDKPKPWMDKLQVLHHLVQEKNSHALIFKFLADPPTTSLQRLKGLTTGSLPTFIDVGNSFGAPAIVEDNIIHQLARNGKRVVMMGDDTWLQLFPTQFTVAHPFPSFNVKDLHTVDNGVIDNLFPALYEDNWDILIGHFLGVDHVGHIFGVESPHMVEKLEQYNKIVERVVSILQNQSCLGGLHEDTLLLVMGDHGQTLNGDHGGGASEEVETALFAWTTRKPAHYLPKILQSPCIFSMGENFETCIRDFPQLDFAATLCALVGVPIPFGSIGQVNADLFSLVPGTWTTEVSEIKSQHKHGWTVIKWMEHYLSVLCLNSQQVNRFFKRYAESRLSGFDTSELASLQMFYEHAHSEMVNRTHHPFSETSPEEGIVKLVGIINAYTTYLSEAAALARSKWTQFGTGMMAFGLIILLLAFVVQTTTLSKLVLCGSHNQGMFNLEDERKFLPISEMVSSSFMFGAVSAVIAFSSNFLMGSSMLPSSNQWGMIILGGIIIGSVKACIFSMGFHVGPSFHLQSFYSPICGCQVDFRDVLAVSLSVIYASSLLSNSFILKEQHVVTFFLASSGLLDLRRAIQRKSKILQVLCFLVFNSILGSISHSHVFKDTQTIEWVGNMHTTARIFLMWSIIVFSPLAVLGCFFIRQLWFSSFLQSCRWAILVGLPITYISMFLHWLFSDLYKSQAMIASKFEQDLIQLYIPRGIYVIVLIQLLILVGNSRNTSNKVQIRCMIADASLPCLAVLSGLILLLLGKQGPAIFLLMVVQGYCLVDLQSLSLGHGKAAPSLVDGGGYLSNTIQWSFYAVQVFFVTGHRCAFDGLRYAAAFIGFDQFNIYRQGILLAIDTFGASHFFPVMALSLLVAKRPAVTKNVVSDSFILHQMYQAFLLYGLVRTMTTLFATLCVTIHRRHLMVWGLFAPKFVFDAIGLLITDVALVVTAVYCLLPALK